MISIASYDLWKKSTRDLVLKTIKECKTDVILTYQLETLVKHVDSDIASERDFSERVDALLNLLNKDHYYDRFRDNVEEKTIRALAAQFNVITKLAKYDAQANRMDLLKNPVEKKEPTRLKQGELKSYEPNDSRKRL